MLIAEDQTAEDVFILCRALIRDAERESEGAHVDRHEILNSVMNGLNHREEIDLLDTFGGQGRLLEPEPDLEADWCDLRSQLAFNALYNEISHRGIK